MRRVVVTGFGVVSPVGVGRDAFWDALAAGAGGVGRISRFDCGTFDVQLGGEVVEPLELPADVQEVAREDPKVGFAFAACAQAVAQAGLDAFDDGTLLHLGTSLEVFHLDKAVVDGTIDFPAITERFMAGLSGPIKIPLDTAAGLIAKAWGRPQRVLTNCSACAAGAQAIGHGFRNIRAGRCDVAVCGGFDSMINPLGVGGFQMLGALTTDTDRGASACRPFDATRSGTVLGEGAAVLVLEERDRAIGRRVRVLAEVCGFGSSLDAHSLSAPDPAGDGAVRAMTAALDDARIAPGDIAHINAHGTGTRLNDEVEAEAIRRVFEKSWRDTPVSSTKGLTGHLIAAAGAIEAGAVLMAFERGTLAANPFLTSVGKGCALAHVIESASGFAGSYALSNSFGFGGQNAALIFGRDDG